MQYNLTLHEMNKAEFKASDKLVFLLLRDQTSGRQRTERGIEVLPNQVLSSEREIAEACDLGKTTARRALQRLHDSGWISICRMGQAGTLFIIRRFPTFEPLKRTAQTLQNQPVLCECGPQVGPPLARGVSGCLDVGSGVGVAVVSPVVSVSNTLAAKKNFAAPGLSARGPNGGEPYPDWGRLTEFIQRAWTKRNPNAKFPQEKGPWMALKNLGRTYEAWELAGIWEDALQNPRFREFADTGWTMKYFVNHVAGFASSSTWHKRAERIRRDWEGPLDTGVVDKLVSMAGDHSLLAEISKPEPPAPAKRVSLPEPEPEPLPEGGLMAMFQEARRKLRETQSGGPPVADPT